MKAIILNIYFWLRLPFLYGVRIIFRRAHSGPGRLSKFLIIRIDRLGDFVLSIPVIENIRLKYPNAVIDVLVRPYLKELAGLVESINNIIVYDNFISTAKRLKKAGYDAVFDLLCDYKLRPAVLTYLSAAPIRLGFSWGFREIFFNKIINPLDYPYDDMAGLQLRLLELVDIPCKVTIPRLSLGPKAEQKEIIIAIHPIGYYESQRWPAERFILLAKRILEVYKVKLRIVGAPEDGRIINYIARGINNPGAYPLLGGISDLAFEFSGCALLICNHSGPMHLAAALGVPTISIMGPANPILWWPKGENQAVIRKDLKCSPCSKGSCRNHQCMDLVTPEEVFEKVKSVMDKLGIGGG